MTYYNLEYNIRIDCEGLEKSVGLSDGLQFLICEIDVEVSRNMQFNHQLQSMTR